MVLTCNIMPKLAVNSSNKEDSSVEDIQTPKPMVVTKTQSLIVALDTEAQKFGKKVLPSKQLLRNTWPPTKHTWDIFSDGDLGAYLLKQATTYSTTLQSIIKNSSIYSYRELKYKDNKRKRKKDHKNENWFWEQ